MRVLYPWLGQTANQQAMEQVGHSQSLVMYLVLILVLTLVGLVVIGGLMRAWRRGAVDQNAGVKRSSDALDQDGQMDVQDPWAESALRAQIVDPEQVSDLRVHREQRHQGLGSNSGTNPIASDSTARAAESDQVDLADDWGADAESTKDAGLADTSAISHPVDTDGDDMDTDSTAGLSDPQRDETSDGASNLPGDIPSELSSELPSELGPERYDTGTSFDDGYDDDDAAIDTGEAWKVGSEYESDVDEQEAVSGDSSDQQTPEDSGGFEHHGLDPNDPFYAYRPGHLGAGLNGLPEQSELDESDSDDDSDDGLNSSTDSDQPHHPK